MGMRATYALIGTDNIATLTTVQWSCYFDQNLAKVLKNHPVEDRQKVVREVFETITKNEHISCVEVANENDLGRGNVLIGDTGFYLSYPQNDYPVKKMDNNWGKIADWHLDYGSIGAIYDLNNPHLVAFFWLDETLNTPTFQIVSLTDLVRDDFVSDFAREQNTTQTN